MKTYFPAIMSELPSELLWRHARMYLPPYISLSGAASCRGSCETIAFLKRFHVPTANPVIIE